MHCKIQLVMRTDDGHEETVMDVITLKKDCQRIEHLGSLNLSRFVGGQSGQST